MCVSAVCMLYGVALLSCVSRAIYLVWVSDVLHLIAKANHREHEGLKFADQKLFVYNMHMDCYRHLSHSNLYQ